MEEREQNALRGRNIGAGERMGGKATRYGAEYLSRLDYGCINTSGKREAV